MVQLDFDKLDDLVPVVAQDYKTSEVLMLAFMNKAAWEKTLATGKAWYYSRGREKLWLKGEESGNFQIVKDIFVDCDEDTILLKVEQVGGACHNGYRSCFYRKVNKGELTVNNKKIFDPKKIYGGDHE